MKQAIVQYRQGQDLAFRATIAQESWAGRVAGHYRLPAGGTAFCHELFIVALTHGSTRFMLRHYLHTTADPGPARAGPSRRRRL